MRDCIIKSKYIYIEFFIVKINRLPSLLSFRKLPRVHLSDLKFLRFSTNFSTGYLLTATKFFKVF